MLFEHRYGYPPPPPWSDITGYEPILDTIRDQNLHRLDGDFLEIGVFLGGGTYKLSKLLAAEAPHRTLVAVDLFDPGFDRTAAEGLAMADIYAAHIDGFSTATQRELFEQVTAGATNVTVVEGDSTKVEIPTDKLAFSFIDGHHAADYVRQDFLTAWQRTVPGGVVALHDYGSTLPSVTHTVNALVGEHAEEIARIWVHGIIVFIQREV